ncbi:MAG: hypothetical protein PHQ72_05935 [Hespellia sp.]|nr:hypothetical protein [Hespellia sp.]
MRKKLKAAVVILICMLLVGVVFVMSPFFPYVRSLAVMAVYSHVCEEDSIMETEDFALQIPGGGATNETDWYPFVMTFTADQEFSSFVGKPGEKLTILYNFPAFNLKKGCSRLYDTKSQYYNGFYGAYLVQQADGTPYGFTADGNIDAEAVSDVARFDFFSLVLEDFGLQKEEEVFTCDHVETDDGYRMAGYDGWIRMSSDILVNGAAHKKQEGVTSYLQYGAPEFPVSEPFAPVEMKSVVYGRYFEEYQASIFFYVMAVDENVCRRCENEVLRASVIE